MIGKRLTGAYKFFCRVCNPAGNYMFKVNNRNSRTRCEICSKLTIKTPERRQWRIVNFEHISHLVLLFLLLTLNMLLPAGKVPIRKIFLIEIFETHFPLKYLSCVWSFHPLLCPCAMTYKNS